MPPSPQYNSDRPFKAIISPCSSCQNRNTDTSQGPVCPRQYWLEQKEQYDQDPASVECPPDYLLIKNSDPDVDGFSNPVYDEDSLTAIVWVAALMDNRLMRGPDGTILTPSIMERDTFDTKYIKCRSLPTNPMATWAGLVTGGLFKEWDRAVVFPMFEEQEHKDIGGFQDPPPVQMLGICSKVNFTFDCTMTSPKTDNIPSGM